MRPACGWRIAHSAATRGRASPTTGVNLADRILEVRRDPVPAADAPHGWTYRNVQLLAAAGAVAPLAAPDTPILVADLLP